MSNDWEDFPIKQLVHEGMKMAGFHIIKTKYHWEIYKEGPCDGVYQQEFISTTFPIENKTESMYCRMFFPVQEDPSPLTMTFLNTEQVMAIHLSVYGPSMSSYIEKYPRAYKCSFARPFPVVHTVDKVVFPTKQVPLRFSLLVLFGIVKCGGNDNPPFKIFDEIAYQTPQKNVLKNFKTMFDNKSLCDVTFVLGDQEMSAHKTVLAAQSKVFEAMFSNEMVEKEESKVVIVDTEMKVFEKFLNYFYTEDVSDLAEVVDGMIILADKYQVDDLKALCENHMVKNLSVLSVVKYLFIADKFYCAELKQKCIELLQKSWVGTLTEESIEVLKNMGQILSKKNDPKIESPS
ncbi:TD and POZ domain-containing protein 1-like [Venturia canescens]|uniref:TD and POZ domain-containing protein 1-like n=1 Tax=Venturia canescens TaxID=32260 RepID=UPI001C9CC2B9|nr:TD and POZ domain-containing protein 1-like [Venturia canescens]XP_043286052.1 TD and POZ domain-containing protein 1-like [Venturia canescens]XP_043286053.1 TD and POZ domain-containing protein 1-like [Venturia canescens]